ncbi:hypothetical protein DF182_00375 [Chitinophaga flava]|uniref:Uncharacterized protein n=1 Tax=Chitinophaga flava TaxID=2259036 RepID=A0A365XYP2_9BACT|nr:hypothetical protein DF182_00375 [Chitinophaga flava]
MSNWRKKIRIILQYCQLLKVLNVLNVAYHAICQDESNLYRINQNYIWHASGLGVVYAAMTLVTVENGVWVF